jgi:hypothetical protein
VRTIYDDGNGGLYSGSASGTLIGNIFYNEGLIVLKGGGLNSYPTNGFGDPNSPGNYQWQMSFAGTHKIPVKIFRCRAPAGHLNASTNPTYATFFTGSTARYPNEQQIIMDPPAVFVTAIGIYNEDFKLVALAKLAQPVRKNVGDSIIFRLRLDM